MKLITKINSVKKFDVYKNKLAIFKMDNELVFLNQNLEVVKSHKYNFIVKDLRFNSEIVVLVSGKDGAFYIFDNEFNHIEYSNKDLSASDGIVKENCLAIYKYDIDTLEQTSGLFNIKEKRILWLNNLVYTPVCFGEYSIGSSDNNLRCLSSYNGSLIWNYDVASLGSFVDRWGELKTTEVVAILGEYKNTIWVSLTNHYLLGFDKSSGKVKYNIREISNFKNNVFSNAIPDSYGMKLDESKGKIIGFSMRYYWEIDCLTGEIKLTDLTISFNEADINSDVADFAYDGKCIYFLQHAPGKIGVFDIESKSLVWQYQFEGMNSRELMPLQIKYANDKLYVLDSGKTLHIYEKSN